jgi:hypothetical protein
VNSAVFSLKEAAWKDRDPSNAAVIFQIYRLRQLLGDDARRPKFIETVKKRGFRFMRPVRPTVNKNESGETQASGERLLVFLCHSSGDKEAVRNLYGRLKQDGFRPWLDEEDLLPGHDWNDEIRRAVRANRGREGRCLAPRIDADPNRPISQWAKRAKQGTYKVVDVGSAPATNAIHVLGAMLAFDFAQVRVPSNTIY